MVLPVMSMVRVPGDAEIDGAAGGADDGGAAAKSLFHGAAMGEASGKRNCIKVVMLLELRIAREMHRVMVLMVMPMVRMLEALYRAMVPPVTPMISAGVGLWCPW